ncbi:DUF1904 family protein [Cohnella yongneupensis]|uniref:DUF1904 family protein n=1 Tax=Cohnella yongneupensis TaxID=425006 RepID=A0ABW0R100_9BACL
MPHLLIRGVDPDRLATVSEALVAELADICVCPPDHILLECLHTTAVFAGKRVASYPFVEVNWFDRGLAVRDSAAACIDRHVRSLGIEEAEVAFRVYMPEAYYANGQRLGEEPSSDQGALQALQEDNARLKDELGKARKALQSAVLGGGATASMSSRLRDALRE